jgi:hypothetical protein
MDSKTIEFLAKLQALCVEYDAEITGCGCCGSPNVTVGLYSLSYVNIESNVLRIDRQTMLELQQLSLEEAIY